MSDFEPTYASHEAMRISEEASDKAKQLFSRAAIYGEELARFNTEADQITFKTGWLKHHKFSNDTLIDYSIYLQEGGYSIIEKTVSKPEREAQRKVKIECSVGHAPKGSLEINSKPYELSTDQMAAILNNVFDNFDRKITEIEARDPGFLVEAGIQALLSADAEVQDSGE